MSDISRVLAGLHTESEEIKQEIGLKRLSSKVSNMFTVAESLLAEAESTMLDNPEKCTEYLIKLEKLIKALKAEVGK